jgi:hypothetical protein
LQDSVIKTMGKSVSIEEPHPDEQHEAAPAPAPAPCYDDDDDDEFSEGLTARQKSALGFIWYLKIFNDEKPKEHSWVYLVF